MLAGQFVVDPECPTINSDISLITNEERTQLIHWIESINEDDPTVLAELDHHSIPEDATVKEIQRRHLREITFTDQDLKFNYSNNGVFDITTFFDIKKKLSIQDVSVAGIEVDANSSKSLHHIILGYQNPRLRSLIPWAKFKNTNLLPEGVEVSVNPQEPLNLMVHRYFKLTQLSADSSKLSIKFFVKNGKGNTHYKIVNYPNPNELNIVGNYTGLLRYLYASTKPYYIKMIAPHMHERGVELIVERVSHKPLAKNSCLAKFYGFIEQGMGKYPFEVPQLINPDERIQITCKYKNTGIPLKMGWGAKEEMCTVFLYITETDFS